MSGLYNMLFRTHPLAGYLLFQLDLIPETVPRLRDAALFKDPEKPDDKEAYLIRVLTRVGGPNAASFADGINRLEKHPLFVRHEDPTYDVTYRYFYFKVPDIVLQELKENNVPLEKAADNASLEEKFENALKQLQEDGGAAPSGSTESS